jgi:hypothetical protein
MKPRETQSLGGYLGTLIETLHMQVEMLKINPTDKSRTVAIDTGYITVVTFNLEDGDKEYAELCGENATRAFLAQQKVSSSRAGSRVGSAAVSLAPLARGAHKHEAAVLRVIGNDVAEL